MNLAFNKKSYSEELLPWQKAPRSAPTRRPRFKRDATQDASVAVSFKGSSASANVNCAKYGEAQPDAKPLTTASRLTAKHDLSSETFELSPIAEVII